MVYGPGQQNKPWFDRAYHHRREGKHFHRRRHQWPRGYHGRAYGALWFTNSAGNSIGRITTKGEVTNYAAAGVVNPIGITNGAGRSLWFTDSYDPGSFGLISTSGRIIIHTSAEIDDPVGITTGPDGDVWMTNAGTRTSKGSIGRLTTMGGSRSSLILVLMSHLA